MLDMCARCAKFVTALKAARDTGKLHGECSLDAGPWRALLAQLHAHEWVVYAKQPPGGPAQVFEYLGRYTHRMAISNERIVAVDDCEVRFRVRDSAAGNRKRLLRLPAATFIDRFLLRWSSRWRRSCAALSASDGRAARIVATATSCRRRPFRCRRGPLFKPADRRKSAMASVCFAPMKWRPEPSGIVAAIGPRRPRPPSACRRSGHEAAIANDGSMTSPSASPSRFLRQPD
jgi:hypothetical protein